MLFCDNFHVKITVLRDTEPFFFLVVAAMRFRTIITVYDDNIRGNKPHNFILSWCVTRDKTVMFLFYHATNEDKKKQECGISSPLYNFTKQ